MGSKILDNNLSQQVSTEGGGTTKEVVYLQYIFNMLTDCRRSFDDGNITRYNLYIQLLKNSVLSKETRDMIDKEMKVEEKKMKDIGLDENYIEYTIGFCVIREVMKYINETMELEHQDIIGNVGMLYNPEDTDEEDVV